MTEKKRVRTVGSIKSELLKKSREAALAAVQIFNNPNIQFKSESFIVLMTIAWTYLLHAYFRGINVDYRYFEKKNGRKRYHRTKNGAYKYWELEKCLNAKHSPVDNESAKNLVFLIGLRHEIEHRMTNRIDDLLSARFQACCLNYNHLIKKHFGDQYGIDQHLSFSLQFSSLGEEQIDMLSAHKELPPNIQRYILSYDEALSDEEYSSPKYAYRVFFVPKIANKKGQADKVVEFIKADSPLADTLNKEYVYVRDTEKAKYLPSRVVKLMQEEGFHGFTMHHHTILWQTHRAKDPSSGFGVDVQGTWYWYESWVSKVREHCRMLQRAQPSLLN